MRKEILDYLKANPELHRYVREDPAWYRKLSRNPSGLQSLQSSSKSFYKKTFSDQVERIANSLGMASVMMQMLQSKGNEE